MELYKRSHGNFAPGEQKKRDYIWNIDPNQTRFGRKGDTIAFNGVSTNVLEVLQGSSSIPQPPVVNNKKVYLQPNIYFYNQILINVCIKN